MNIHEEYHHPDRTPKSHPKPPIVDESVFFPWTLSKKFLPTVKPAVPQMRAFGLKIDDSSRHVGGTQQIMTPEGYVIPLCTRDSRAYVDMHPPRDEELDRYPHVFFTEDAPWNPKSLDNEWTPCDSDWPSFSMDATVIDPRINAFGELVNRHVSTLECALNDDFETMMDVSLDQVCAEQSAPQVVPSRIFSSCARCRHSQAQLWFCSH